MEKNPYIQKSLEEMTLAKNAMEIAAAAQQRNVRTQDLNRLHKRCEQRVIDAPDFSIRNHLMFAFFQHNLLIDTPELRVRLMVPTMTRGGETERESKLSTPERKKIKRERAHKRADRKRNRPDKTHTSMISSEASGEATGHRAQDISDAGSAVSLDNRTSDPAKTHAEQRISRYQMKKTKLSQDLSADNTVSSEADGEEINPDFVGIKVYVPRFGDIDRALKRLKKMCQDEAVHSRPRAKGNWKHIFFQPERDRKRPRRKHAAALEQELNPYQEAVLNSRKQTSRAPDRVILNRKGTHTIIGATILALCQETGRIVLTRDIEKQGDMAAYEPVPFSFLAEITTMSHELDTEEEELAGRWGLPGGHFEPHDINILTTAVRELEEETAIDLRKYHIIPRKIGEVYLTERDDMPKQARNPCYALFLAKLPLIDPEELRPGEEQDKVILADPAMIRDLLKNNQILQNTASAFRVYSTYLKYWAKDTL